MSAHNRGIDHHVFVVVIACQQLENALENAAFRPSTEALVYDLPVEAFRKCGTKYIQSERDRSAIYLDCLPLFTAGRVHLIDNARIVSQFASLERRTSSVGKDKIDHGPNGHDDACNSAAGALVLAASKKAPFVVTKEILARASIPDRQFGNSYGRASSQMKCFF
jgi:hypothetical protein